MCWNGVSIHLLGAAFLQSCAWPVVGPHRVKQATASRMHAVARLTPHGARGVSGLFAGAGMGKLCAATASEAPRGSCANCGRVKVVKISARKLSPDLQALTSAHCTVALRVCTTLRAGCRACAILRAAAGVPTTLGGVRALVLLVVHTAPPVGGHVSNVLLRAAVIANVLTRNTETHPGLARREGAHRQTAAAQAGILVPR
jgi:hypothetical protein